MSLLEVSLFVQFLVDQDYVEDHSLSNFRLAVGFIACLFGCLGQFYPLPFPDNKYLLAVCVVGFSPSVG